MIEGDGFDAAVIDEERPFLSKGCQVGDLGTQLVELNGEKSVTQIVVKNSPQALHTGRKAAHGDVGGGLERGIKKGKSLNVVPVHMGYEQVNVDRISLIYQVITQGSDAGSGIHNDFAAALEIDLQTTGVSPVHDGFSSGGGNGSPCPPKRKLHLMCSPL